MTTITIPLPRVIAVSAALTFTAGLLVTAPWASDAATTEMAEAHERSYRFDFPGEILAQRA